MTTVEERFGERVRDLRRERGWSQEELAHRSGLHRTYISSLERGERNASLKVVQRLADAFLLTIQSLMDI